MTPLSALSQLPTRLLFLCSHGISLFRYQWAKMENLGARKHYEKPVQLCFFLFQCPFPSSGSSTAIHCAAPLFCLCWPTEPCRLVSHFLGRTNASQKDAHAVKISIFKMKAHWKVLQKWNLNACGSKALCWKATVFYVWCIWPRKTEVSCLNQKTALHTGGLNGLQIFRYWQCKMLCASEVAEIYLLGRNTCGV